HIAYNAQTQQLTFDVADSGQTTKTTAKAITPSDLFNGAGLENLLAVDATTKATFTGSYALNVKAGFDLAADATKGFNDRGYLTSGNVLDVTGKIDGVTDTTGHFADNAFRANVHSYSSDPNQVQSATWLGPCTGNSAPTVRIALTDPHGNQRVPLTDLIPAVN